MALADIISKITSDAEDEAARILADAREQAEAITAEAEAAAEQHRTVTLARAEADAQREADRIVVSARLAARDAALRQRGQLVDETLATAAEKIAAASPTEYASFLARRIARVAKGGETLRLGSADTALGPAIVEALRMIAPGLDLRLADEPAAFERGALVEGDRVRADLSLHALIEEYRDDLELAVAAVLFPEEA